MKAVAKFYNMNIKDKCLFRLLSKTLLAVGSSYQPFVSFAILAILVSMIEITQLLLQ